MERCAICFDDVESWIRCDYCKVPICEDCFSQYSNTCIESQGKLAKCIGRCEYEYLYGSFPNSESRERYADIIYTYLKRNDDFMFKVNVSLQSDRIVESIMERKMNFIKRLPKALRYVIKVAMQDKYKEVMKINQEIVESQINKFKGKRCFNGICNTGILNRKNDGNWECDSCLNIFCEDCERRINGDHICSQEDLDSVRMINSLARCPQCKAPAEKVSGCDSVTCTVCGTNYLFSKNDYGGHGGPMERIKLIDKKYSLSEEIKDKYPSEILDEVEELENKLKELPPFSIFSDYLTEEDITMENKVELFKIYSNFRVMQISNMKINRKLIEIRQLHIDANLTLSELNKVLNG